MFFFPFGRNIPFCIIQEIFAPWKCEDFLIFCMARERGKNADAKKVKIL